MNITFVEMEWFTKRLKSRLLDDEYIRFQQALLENPHLGTVMPGCGGLRKMRWGDVLRARGKRGAFRVIYLWVPEAFRIDLLDIYGKNEKADLTPKQKKVLAKLAAMMKEEAIRDYRRSKGRT